MTPRALRSAQHTVTRPSGRSTSSLSRNLQTGCSGATGLAMTSRACRSSERPMPNNWSVAAWAGAAFGARPSSRLPSQLWGWRSSYESTASSTSRNSASIQSIVSGRSGGTTQMTPVLILRGAALFRLTNLWMLSRTLLHLAGVLISSKAATDPPSTLTRSRSMAPDDRMTFDFASLSSTPLVSRETAGKDARPARLPAMTASIEGSLGCRSVSPPLCSAISPTAQFPVANSSSSAFPRSASSMCTDGLSKSRLHHLHRRLHRDENSMFSQSSEIPGAGGGVSVDMPFGVSN